jgi:acetylornithine deacetylase/succinyl-diaminopimelate desuccinylase-like protein
VDPAWQSELAEFLAIPSVSADPAHADDVLRAGEWVCEFIRRAGGSAELTPFGRSHLAVGELSASGGGDGKPTLLVYGHFDVQPPAPLDLWDSDPFTLSIRDEWAYARGIADDKGQLYLLLKAAALLAHEGTLPLNLRFVCDGEEEIGGTTVVDYLRDGMVAADAAVIFDSDMVAVDRPAFNIATRGLIAFDVTIRAGERDLHSGLYGGAALNAVNALVRTLEPLLAGADGRLPEPLRQGIRPPSADELAGWSQLPPGADELAQQGAVPLDARAAEEFYVRTWAEPSLDVNGIIGGKPGLRNTTISAEASAQFTLRLVDDQQVGTIGSAAEQLLRQAAPPGAEVVVEWEGTPPGGFPADAPALRLGQDAFERALGVRPLLIRSGGTLPIVPALVERGVDTIVTGFALPTSNIHSPNERMLVRYFDAGVATARELFVALGGL